MSDRTIIIPAIDLIDGKCVRLTQGDYARKKEYSKDPLEMAKEYEDCGIRRLHIVDLDGAKAKRPCNLAVLEKIAGATSLDIEWGGGIKDSSALRSALDAGAGRIICGSIAVDDRWEFTSWLSAFGPSRIILGADVREGKVATHGWLKDSGLSLDELMGWYVPEGLSQMICTDISKDGMLQGPDFEFYTDLMQSWPSVDVTLSGGISCMEDIVKADESGLHSVIVGKAIYEGRINLKEIESWLLKG
ncbi:MAG: 1-(5-phosphoribosyl)-5-[(5-phosphoribosylamino)methylideneamino]imidazole-4-carboxamide isomerase [Bacteroidales bacterium]|nr:1-(5-phosphoribosyl)-5-[(5-phosphoribosylamino)methylideneamino]imidazole-4-carboxamide isomerase [Bacteroidales bacterium]